MSSADERVAPQEPVDPIAGADPSRIRAPEHASPEHAPVNGSSGRWNDRVGLATVAVCLVIAGSAWYLLKEFAPLLRPLLLAIFLCYVILPSHHRLTRHIPALASVILLAGVSVGFLVLLAWQIVGSAAQLTEDMPRLLERAQGIIHSTERYAIDHLPAWLSGEVTDLARGQTLSVSWFRQVAAGLAGAAADTFTEAVLVGIYLVFFLVDAGRVPRRIESAFREEQSDQVLAVVGNINRAMAGYLRVKVKASLVLALPVTVVLWTAGMPFTMMWGMLTFVLNFIPYLGSVIACSGPIILAFLQMDSIGRPAVVAVLLVTLHTLSAYAIEPSMTGKAVGLSPVVILVSLSFWGLCWGITGMLLAVPLTVMVKVIMENVAFTQPVARLMAED